MKNKKKKKKIQKEQEDIIIGYNSRQSKDKPPKKKKKDKNKWKKVKTVLLFLLKIIIVIGILVAIGAFLFISPVFNITEIRVEGASKISQNTYIALSEVKTEENIFRINKLKIKENIKSESYVESIEVKRELPGTVVLTVTERTPKYMIEKNGGQYMYIDKNGYYLEASMAKIEAPILKGIETDTEDLKLGDRLNEKDLDKFNDVIKIIDGIKNNNIDENLTSIDISDHNSYILEFADENKTIMLGDISNLSTKMVWIKYFMQEKADDAGTVHLDTENVYFSPKKTE